MVLTTKKSFHLLDNSFLQDVEIMIFQRLARSSSLHSTDYDKMFMASFNLLLLNGYASGFEDGRFTHLLLVVTTKSELKLRQTHHVHLA